MENRKAVLATRETGADLLADGDIEKIVWLGGQYEKYCIIAYPGVNGGIGFVEIKGASDEDVKDWVLGIRKKRPNADLVISTWC